MIVEMFDVIQPYSAVNATKKYNMILDTGNCAPKSLAPRFKFVQGPKPRT